MFNGSHKLIYETRKGFLHFFLLVKKMCPPHLAAADEFGTFGIFFGDMVEKGIVKDERGCMTNNISIIFCIKLPHRKCDDDKHLFISATLELAD